MKQISNNALDNITGGANDNLTGSLINSFVNIIKLLIEAGESVGSSIRRVAEGNVCPLK